MSPPHPIYFDKLTFCITHLLLYTATKYLIHNFSGLLMLLGSYESVGQIFLFWGSNPFSESNEHSLCAFFILTVSRFFNVKQNCINSSMHIRSVLPMTFNFSNAAMKTDICLHQWLKQYFSQIQIYIIILLVIIWNHFISYLYG